MTRFDLTHFHVPALHMPHLAWPWSAGKRKVPQARLARSMRASGFDSSLEESDRPAPTALMAGLLVAGAATVVAAIVSLYAPVEAVDAAPAPAPEFASVPFAEPGGSIEVDPFALAKHVAIEEELPPQF